MNWQITKWLWNSQLKTNEVIEVLSLISNRNGIHVQFIIIIIINPLSQLTKVGYMNLTFSFSLIQDNLIGKIARLKVFSCCFYPNFLRSSSPSINPLVSRLSILLTVASMILLYIYVYIYDQTILEDFLSFYVLLVLSLTFPVHFHFLFNLYVYYQLPLIYLTILISVTHIFWICSFLTAQHFDP